jgi:hypothetical protein
LAGIDECAEHAIGVHPEDQATRLAAAVADRSGIFVHLTCEPEQIAARLLARDGYALAPSRIRAFTEAYARSSQFSPIMFQLPSSIPRPPYDPVRPAASSQFRRSS